jgi:hypothetical protein
MVGCLTLLSPTVAMYTICFNIIKLCIFYVFHVIFTINRDFIPKEHSLVGLFSGEVVRFLFLFVSLGSNTVQLHDSLGGKRACASSEAGFSSQNGEHA